MNTHFRTTLTSILLAITVAAASGVVEAGKGNGGGAGQNSDFGAGNGAMYGPGPTTGYGYEKLNSSQYRHQPQNQYRNDNGRAEWNMNSADSGKGQYSNDKYLNQKDFQAWLYQNQDQLKNQNQERNQGQTMFQDGL